MTEHYIFVLPMYIDVIQKLPEFTLMGADGVLHSPFEYSTKDIIVLIFSCNHCIYAKAYLKRIKMLIKKYRKGSVGFFIINSSDALQYPTDTYEAIITAAKKTNLENYILHDETQGIALTMNVSRTVETLIFDKDRNLAYRGAIDDNWTDEEKVSVNYVEEALNALLAGVPVITARTESVGTYVKWKMYN